MNSNVYVADSANDCIQKFSPDGVLLSMRGSKGSENGQFLSPCGVAVDESGNVYVADSSNYRIQKFSPDGNFLAKWGSRGSGDGQFGKYYGPLGLAVDRNGNVYVADSGNGRIQKFNSDGVFLAAWRGHGRTSSLAVDGNGNVYVACLGSDHPPINLSAGDGNGTDDQRYGIIYKFSSEGVLLTSWGSYGSGDGKLQESLWSSRRWEWKCLCG